MLARALLVLAIVLGVVCPASAEDAKPPLTRTVFVGHGTPPKLLGGDHYLAEGEAAIFRPTPKGPVYVTSIKADEWIQP